MPSPQEICEKLLQSSLQSETPKEVHDKVLQSRLQIESDLPKIEVATTSDYGWLLLLGEDLAISMTFCLEGM